MAITNLPILPTTTVGTPSGNYDGSTDHFISDAAKAVDYYQGQGSLQTVFVQATGFEGVVTFQATLDYDADQANWFDVYEYSSASSIITDYHPQNLIGNFVWMRVSVSQFNAGSIGVSIAY